MGTNRLCGPAHPLYKGNLIDSDGYVTVWVRTKKQCKELGLTPHTCNCHRREHVLIAEKVLGRRLKKGEVVHHWNGIKTDNRHSNLLICTRPYHAWLHQEMARRWQQEHFGGAS